MLAIFLATATLIPVRPEITIAVPNEVTVTDSNGNSRAPYDMGWGPRIDLIPGDVIKTGIVSATFSEFYGATIDFAPRTEVKYLGAGSDPQLQILVGSFHYSSGTRLQKEPTIYKRIVKSRTRTIGSDGTDFTVVVSNNFDQQKTSTTVTVTHGAAIVESWVNDRIVAGQSKSYEDKLFLAGPTLAPTGTYQRSSRGRGRTMGSGGL